jgi:hypothetical protein
MIISVACPGTERHHRADRLAGARRDLAEIHRLAAVEPDADREHLRNIPAELIERRQWVLWRYVQQPGEPKPRKVPYTMRGGPASTTRPADWTTFEAVCIVQQRSRFWDGIGYVFIADDPFTGIDLDHVWQSDADEGAPWGNEILERFSDTYLEESPSERGVKIFCRARLPHGGRSWPVEGGAVEIYDRRRYFAVTGKGGPARVITDHQADVDSLIEYLDGGKRKQASPVTITGKIPYGTQHKTLVSMAGTMRKRGMSPDAIEAALQVVNVHQCERPGAPENIHKIAMSAARWPR